jgi:signal transduction histidine kinase
MKLARNPVVRALVGVLCALSILAVVLSFAVAEQVSSYGGYRSSVKEGDFINQSLKGQMYQDLNEVADYYSMVLGTQGWADSYLAEYESDFAQENTNFFFQVTDYDTGETLLSSYDASPRVQLWESAYLSASTEAGQYDRIYEEYDEDGYYSTTVTSTGSSSGLHHVVLTGYVRADVLTSGVDDEYRQTAENAQQLYQWRNRALLTAGAGGVLFLLTFLYLFFSAGRRNDSEEIHLSAVDQLPWDLMLVLSGGLAFLVLLAVDLLDYQWGVRGGELSQQGFLLCCLTLVLFILFLVVALSFSARWKTKNWAQNSLIYRVWSWCGALLHHPLHYFHQWVVHLPLIWKSLLSGLVLVVLEIISLYHLYWDGDPSFIIGLNFIVAMIVLPALVSMRLLQQGGHELAEGHLDYQVDTQLMFLDFRAHGADLNRIGEGISAAVEERLKSERFQTELITNVSHDLKTPLTSIVNYVDLLSRLELPQEARAYVDVLQRQSARLKKLTEDLVEASKASTGNLSVDISDVDLGELVKQVTGEYEERFERASLTPVLQVEGSELTALGDGRYLWRIMDNLLSNVCKYALPGTRVYIDAGLEDGAAVISVKNISRDRLNIGADELMKRFVRGDASRTTEGSGLGLSIALSLAELMGGSLKLLVDGDLFKAELHLRCPQQELPIETILE